ncbi:hypothetical protein CB0940_03697 [Cercospora beticola]|uniref:F-box domain-containing protein n=1 Tax=Cercospora beticola TaxID=122368 RepID=A0A2G5I315_CERBT|nr:hypothetical protein CB0940_03697 [Cercospora beticola]PIA99189.1 hypothetical protein CB0940_03697 [Cercospora beticola]WPB00879.1 hypothetical protein RHO25_005499 [Cercospora beticola]CAK1360874.1 unnamed protein product [Cercospora beticola]
MAMPPPSGKPPLPKPSPLKIPELLEEVIMHLPLRDILLCQRVDTHFRDVVQGSSNIKKVLFLEPATDKDVVYHETVWAGAEWKRCEDGEVVRPLMNPFLMSIFATEKRFWEWAPFDTKIRRSYMGVNCGEDPQDFSNLSLPGTSTHFRVSKSRVAKAAKMYTTQALQVYSNCYAQMLLTHPPCKELGAKAWEDGFAAVETPALLEGPGLGVRFGALREFAGALLSRQLLTCSPAKPLVSLQVTLAGFPLWRVCPESVLDHVTGWEMLAVMNNPHSMDDQIDHIITARKTWDHVADGSSHGDNEPKEAFAWELETVEQESPFETVMVGSGPW